MAEHSLLDQVTNRGRFREKVAAGLRDLEAHGWQPKIIEAIRTPERQQYLYSIGRSRTLRSRHLPGPDGLSAAVDIIDERYGWSGPEARRFFLYLARVMLLHGCTSGVLWLRERSARPALKAFLTEPSSTADPFNPSEYEGPLGWDCAHVQKLTR